MGRRVRGRVRGERGVRGVRKGRVKRGGFAAVGVGLFLEEVAGHPPSGHDRGAQDLLKEMEEEGDGGGRE